MLVRLTIVFLLFFIFHICLIIFVIKSIISSFIVRHNVLFRCSFSSVFPVGNYAIHTRFLPTTLALTRDLLWSREFLGFLREHRKWLLRGAGWSNTWHRNQRAVLHLIKSRAMPILLETCIQLSLNLTYNFCLVSSYFFFSLKMYLSIN